jgi:NAD(P)H-nitrite reductase large subunit
MRYVIIGGSAAGISALEAIRSIDHESQIDLFSDEATPLFSRVLLPYYVAEELPKPLLNFRSADFFDQNHVTPHLGVKVCNVSPESKTVETEEATSYSYDKLLIATGGKPIVPSIPGIDKEGVSPLKTMEDAERVYHTKGTKAIVIGAGSIGVESSISLKRRGLKVSLLEQLGHVLPTVFDEEGASIIKTRIEELGINVITGERAIQMKGNHHVRGVVTDTREIDCDMVVLAVGVRPADPTMMTSAQDIYAAGDVVETYDIARGTHFINAIWPCAIEQGRVAGLNMAGQNALYEGSFRRNSIGNFIGVPAISIGVTHVDVCTECAPGDQFQEIKKRTKDIYRKLILRNGCIIGAILVGQTQKAGLMTVLLKKQIDVSDFIPILMDNSLNFMDLLPLLRRNADKFTEPEYKEIMDTGL